MSTHIEQHYEQLLGMTVVATGTTDTKIFGVSEDVPYLLFRSKDGKLIHAYVLRDPEGNGPGHLEISPSSV